MQRLTEAIAWLAVWCGQSITTIALLTGITAGLLAGIILYLRRLVLIEENWARYFGWAYAVFGLQYILHAVAGWTMRNAAGLGTDWAHTLPFVYLSSQALFSPISNLLFLASARALLDRKKAMQWHWIGIAFATSLLGMGPQTFLYRLPDALFSLYCLGTLGWAMFLNFGPRRRPWLASTTLVGAGLYGLLSIAYSLNPTLAQQGYWSSLLKVVYPFAGSLTALQCLDALVVAVAFTLRINLFLGAFMLLIRLMLNLSPMAARELFREVRESRTQYLEGILKVLGLSVEADLAALYILLPGNKRSEVSQRLWLWNATHEETAVKTIPFPPVDSVLGTVLRHGQEIVVHNLKSGQAPKDLPDYSADVTRALVIVPIRYHGAVIGCLDFEWQDPIGFSATALQRIRHAGDLLAPAVHTRREIVALDRLTDSFRALGVSERGPDWRLTLESLLTVVHDILSPLETFCRIDFGFRSARISCNDSGCFLSVPSPTIIDKGPAAEAVLPLRRVDMNLISEALTVKAPQMGASELQEMILVIGEIEFSLAEDRDPGARPSLIIDHLLRRTVASLLADAVLSATRLDLENIHNRFQLDLNSREVVSIVLWFDVVQKTVLDAGMCWAVAELCDEEPNILGDQEDKDFVLGLLPDRNTLDESLSLFPLSTPRRGAGHIVKLPLRAAGGYLWLGVGRQGFGPELQFSSPWRTFLERLSRSADSALIRIAQQRLQDTANQLELVATKVEMNRLLIHELGNVTASLAAGVQRIDETLPKSGDPVPAEFRKRILRLKDSIDEFRRLVNSILRPVPTDYRRSIPLSEAVAAIRALYGESFKAREIQLRLEIDPNLSVAVPLEAAYLAISNLVLNAADAIRHRGIISIQAELSGDFVLCHVTDNGPGIPSHLKEEIFDITFTTKVNGSGLGLTLARNAMKRQGGDLTLTETRPGCTRFTLRFPNALKRTK